MTKFAVSPVNEMRWKYSAIGSASPIWITVEITAISNAKSAARNIQASGSSIQRSGRRVQK